jgi:hypothetical protein
MATNGIATRADANIKKPGAYTSDLKRCITKSSAVSVGLTVSGSYANNQLVPYSRISYSSPLIIRLTIDLNNDSKLYNKGPITLCPAGSRVSEFEPLKTSAPKIEDIREVESSEITHDTESLPLSYNDDSLSDKTQSDASMSLMSLDEVLQIADEYENGITDNIHGVSAVILGMTLIKDGGLNLLTDTSYGPSVVLNSNKTVTFTLINKPSSSSSDYGQYVLSHPGSSMSYLVNSSGLCPTGGLYVLNSTSSQQNQSITISGPGTYTFSAYWIPRTITPVDPSTGNTYTFRLRFALDGIAVYQVYVKLECVIISSNGTSLSTIKVPGTAYRPYELPSDMAQVNERSYYYIDLWTGTTLPYYVKITTVNFMHNANNLGNWLVTSYEIQNSSYFGSYPSISGMAYYTLNPRGNIYSVDYLIGGGALRPL